MMAMRDFGRNWLRLGATSLLVSFMMLILLSEQSSLTAINLRIEKLSQKPAVNILFGLSGSHPGFLAEFEAALKSVLLNNPRNHDMDIHVMADGEAYGVLGQVFTRTGLDGSIWENKISIETYNVEPHTANWTKTIEASTPYSVKEMTSRHTIGAFFRLFAYQVLPDTVDHVLYMDVDAVIMANLADLWHRIDQNATFQWGADQCSGFMILNMKKAGSIWDLATRCDLEEIRNKSNLNLDDQLIFKSVNATFPEVVGVLPTQWAISYADAYVWAHEKDIVDFRPKVGMLHFNGGGSSKDAYYDAHKVLKKQPWEVASYYAKLPWPWARYMGESMTSGSEGHPFVIRHGKSREHQRSNETGIKV